MKITDEAKKYIKSYFNEEINGIIIDINKFCCVFGEDIKIAFGKVDDNYFIVDELEPYTR